MFDLVAKDTAEAIQVGAELRARRKQLKLSRADIADVLDVTEGHVSNMEAGRRKPTNGFYRLIMLEAGIKPIEETYILPDGRKLVAEIYP
jgi:transcriptional regulator with XRE-family HTH domain